MFSIENFSATVSLAAAMGVLAVDMYEYIVYVSYMVDLGCGTCGLCLVDGLVRAFVLCHGKYIGTTRRVYCQSST